jgi:hypothetical protein
MSIKLLNLVQGEEKELLRNLKYNINYFKIVFDKNIGGNNLYKLVYMPCIFKYYF